MMFTLIKIKLNKAIHIMQIVMEIHIFFFKNDNDNFPCLI